MKKTNLMLVFLLIPILFSFVEVFNNSDSYQTKDTEFVTDIFYICQNEENSKESVAFFIKEIHHMSELGVVRPCKTDLVEYRERNYLERCENFLKADYKTVLADEKLINEQLEMEVKIPLGKENNEFVFPYGGFFSDHYSSNHHSVVISFYVKPNFSKTEQRELLSSYRILELYQNAIRDNPELKEWEKRFDNKNINLTLNAYINPVTGNKIIFTSKEDLLPLSAMLQKQSKDI